MDCTVGFASCFCELVALAMQHGTRQQGWYFSGTLRKQFSNLTVQFILSHSIGHLEQLVIKHLQDYEELGSDEDELEEANLNQGMK